MLRATFICFATFHSFIVFCLVLVYYPCILVSEGKRGREEEEGSHALFSSFLRSFREKGMIFFFSSFPPLSSLIHCIIFLIFSSFRSFCSFFWHFSFILSPPVTLRPFKSRLHPRRRFLKSSFLEWMERKQILLELETNWRLGFKYQKQLPMASLPDRVLPWLRMPGVPLKSLTSTDALLTTQSSRLLWRLATPWSLHTRLSGSLNRMESSSSVTSSIVSEDANRYVP